MSQEADPVEAGTSTRIRSSAACDGCRARKVKCVFKSDQAKCTTCVDLNIACLKIQPRKKRGPKNRYVRALQSQLDGETCFENLQPLDLGKQNALGSPYSPAAPLSLLDIAPRDLLDQILTDWFGWIHPVAPILHRGQFMARIDEAWTTGDISSSFSILVASICAATVASIRRRRPLYGTVSVDGCLEYAERLGLWNRANAITLEWSLAMYNFSSATNLENGQHSPACCRLGAEATIAVKYLLYHEMDRMSFMDQQILKRLYCLLYAGQCTGDMFGGHGIILHPAHENIQSLLPLEASDEDLLRGVYEGGAPDQSPNASSSTTPSYVPGLNALARLFSIWQSSQATSTRTISRLQEHIDRTQHILDELPPELSWNPSSRSLSTTQSFVSDFGTDVQTVNLKVSQLHIRANLLEQMHALARTENMLLTPSIILEERHRVVNELLDVLYNASYEVFDANGYSIVPKIRDIGSTLLDEIRSGEASHGTTLQASVNLDRLLAKLEDLDVVPM
ncbi:hypothetical protein B0J11DRAFT_123302 [Dendryphion nanum]|uniref:Zn(2)-C6 fungal-type domain-containing protein n=1 Tax=Dendryphion nanum TaxID=256645 RepID=A0A9P9D9A7_9PLEO|nr:hypothetical protein B0J11DRAFT_123302 [Dendryphion nanum]